MIGDVIKIKAKYLNSARQVLKVLMNDIVNRNNHYSISIAGESGSGKSTLAVALSKLLESMEIPAIILHMDDYFILPPASNHQNRMKSLENVGPQEVRLALIDQHLRDIKISENTQLKKPLSDYANNIILEENIDIPEKAVVIVEGTYTSLLGEINSRIFIDRDYKTTFEDRKKRARDPITPFIEQVLEIEHQIIKKHKALADVVIDATFKIAKP